MNGVHDMGGMHGFGPIEREENEPVFHQAWESRVFAMRVATPVPIPGGGRHSIENMDPAYYLTSSYYEKWLQSRIKGFIDVGTMTAAELEARIAYYRDNPGAPVPRSEDPELVKRRLAQLRAWKSPRREVDIPPQFGPGDAVRAGNMHPPGHTRLPRYVRGKRGTVARYYGLYDLQDTVPPGTAAPPQPMYAVGFAGQELWGETAEVNTWVYLDMWESYLEPA